MSGKFRYKRILAAYPLDLLIENFYQGIVGDCLEIDFVGDGSFRKPV